MGTIEQLVTTILPHNLRYEQFLNNFWFFYTPFGSFNFSIFSVVVCYYGIMCDAQARRTNVFKTVSLFTCNFSLHYDNVKLDFRTLKKLGGGKEPSFYFIFTEW